jgi:hypothetical protein
VGIIETKVTHEVSVRGAGAPLIEKVRFAEDSPLEGAGFEPSVPLEVLTVGIVPCRLRGPFHASLPKTKFAADSALEGDGFELSVPRERGDRFELSLLFMSLKPSAF